MSLFLAADACLSWSLQSITKQQVSPHRLPMEYWPKNHRLSSNTPHTQTVFLIQQSCIIITFLCLVIGAHAYTWRKNGVIKEAIVLQWVVRIASCDFKPGKKWWAGALLSEKCCSEKCAKTIVKESRKFELARLKKKKKEKHFGHLVTFRFSISRCFLAPLGVLFIMENTRRWTVGCYNGL